VIAVVDYGAGNIASVENALQRIGAPVQVTHDRAVILAADGVIVPGVGAAADTMHHLDSLGLVLVIREVITSGTPYLGICMGMQVLLTRSLEGGEHQCMDLIPGTVRKLPGSQAVPHIGWNNVHQVTDSPLFDGIPASAEFYFVHSYYVDPEDASWIGARTEYDIDFASAVVRGNVMGTQFHPEKSGKVGLQLLANFIRLVAETPRPTALRPC
jgi:glutamine amidotransferase